MHMVTRYDPDVHHRHSIRLRSYDYSRAGAYFVTICVRDRAPILGTVVEDRVDHTGCGRAVADCWRWLAERDPHVDLDEWIVIGDHTAVEVKAKPNVAAQDLRSLLALAEEGVLRTLICVSLEPPPRTVGALRILPWRDFLDALWAREFH